MVVSIPKLEFPRELRMPSHGATHFIQIQEILCGIGRPTQLVLYGCPLLVLSSRNVYVIVVGIRTNCFCFSAKIHAIMPTSLFGPTHHASLLT